MLVMVRLGEEWAGPFEALRPVWQGLADLG